MKKNTVFKYGSFFGTHHHVFPAKVSFWEIEVRNITKSKKSGGSHQHDGENWHGEYMIDCESIQWYTRSNGKFYCMGQRGIQHDPRVHKNTKVGYHQFEDVW